MKPFIFIMILVVLDLTPTPVDSPAHVAQRVLGQWEMTFKHKDQSLNDRSALLAATAGLSGRDETMQSLDLLESAGIGGGIQENAARKASQVAASSTLP
jgi:hypothetical protein